MNKISLREQFYCGTLKKYNAELLLDKKPHDRSSSAAGTIQML